MAVATVGDVEIWFAAKVRQDALDCLHVDRCWLAHKCAACDTSRQISTRVHCSIAQKYEGLHDALILDGAFLAERYAAFGFRLQLVANIR